MKKENLIKCICAITLLVLSLVETIVAAIFGALQWYLLVPFQILSIVGVGLVCFPYQIAQLRNALFVFFFRKDSDDFEYEPSVLAINGVKLCGYIFLSIPVFLYPVIVAL